MRTVRLITRDGSFVGYADVNVNNTLNGLPGLPEVITLKQATERTFVARWTVVPDAGAMPEYIERAFDWASDFRLTPVDHITRGEIACGTE